MYFTFHKILDPNIGDPDTELLMLSGRMQALWYTKPTGRCERAQLEANSQFM